MRKKLEWIRLIETILHLYRAAAAYYPNFCTGIKDNCTEPECFTGISGKVWKTLYESLNFTFTVDSVTLKRPTVPHLKDFFK